MIDTKKYKELLEKELEETRARRAELESTNPANDEMRTIDNELDDDYTEAELGFRTNELIERNKAHNIEVIAALQRIEDGTYGVCENCKKEINPERLDILPWTTSCINCEEETATPSDV